MNQETFNPETRTLRKIFLDADSFYQIPKYQRPYCWEDEHVDNLWEDIKEAYLDFKNRELDLQEYAM